MNPTRTLSPLVLALAACACLLANTQTNASPPSFPSSLPATVIDAPDLTAPEILAQAEQWMDRGLELAEQNQVDSAAAFQQAATRYETLVIEHGARNAPLLRAMGVAKLHAGDLAGSITSLRAAALLDPTDARTHESLTAARERVEATPEIALATRADQWIVIWRGWVPRSAMLGAGLGLLGLGWLIGAAQIVCGRPRRAWIAVSFVLAALPLALLGHDFRQSQRVQHVVLGQEAVGRGGPSAEIYQPSFEDPLPEGLEAVSLDARAGWTQIRLASDERTWVRSDSLIRVESLLTR